MAGNKTAKVKQIPRLSL